MSLHFLFCSCSFFFVCCGRCGPHSPLRRPPWPQPRSPPPGAPEAPFESRNVCIHIINKCSRKAACLPKAVYKGPPSTPSQDPPGVSLSPKPSPRVPDEPPWALQGFQGRLKEPPRPHEDPQRVHSKLRDAPEVPQGHLRDHQSHPSLPRSTQENPQRTQGLQKQRPRGTKTNQRKNKQPRGSFQQQYPTENDPTTTKPTTTTTITSPLGHPVSTCTSTHTRYVTHPIKGECILLREVCYSQTQISRPLPSRHYKSMEYRLWRTHL